MVWLLVVVVVLIAAFVTWRWYARAPGSTTTSVSASHALEDPATASSVERYPVSAIAAPEPAPAASSADAVTPDEPAHPDTLENLPGGLALAPLLQPSDLIPRIVATVDALPRKRMARKVLPVQPPAGSFRVTHAGDGRTLIEDSNAQRYTPYLDAAMRLDNAALVGWYLRHYPEFEQAYRELGYPDGHFNDRLVAVIDVLLATPQPKSTPELVPHKAGWAFADSALESLAAGQKLLLRLPPTEQVPIRTRLRELRAALTGAQPAAATVDRSPIEQD